MKSDVNVKPIRLKTLAPNVIIVDGVSGTGKTMISHILSTFDRVEKVQYAPCLEHVLEYHRLGHITLEATTEFIRFHLDMLLYNQLQGRNMNLRWGDLSSIWKTRNKARYLKRLFSEGDMAIPDIIERKKPILLIETHHILKYAYPILEAFPRALFINVVRHPLYCLRQQARNWDRLTDNPRNFNLHVKDGDSQAPFTFHPKWAPAFSQFNSIEKAIYEMKSIDDAPYDRGTRMMAKTLTICFERVTRHPTGDINDISRFTRSIPTKKTWKELKRQKLPRELFTAGKNERIYRRVGWVRPDKNSTEKDQYIKLWNWVKANASDAAIIILEKLCQKYEERWKIKL